MSGSRSDDVDAPGSSAPAPAVAIGVDVGGTKVACGLVDAGGRVLVGEREPIDAGGLDGRRPAEQIAGMIQRLANTARAMGREVAACGVAVPAVVDRKTGRVVWAPNIPGWRDLPLKELLQARTGMRVHVEHDGLAAVAGEQWVGAARGLSHVALVIVGTGIGAGFVLDGRVYRGAGGIAGAVGWSCLESDAVDAPRYRGKGFLETVAAGPGIAREAQSEVSSGRRSLAVEMAGGDVSAITAEVVFRAADRGDEVARDVLARAVRYLGMAASALVSILNPEIVVFGGGVGRQLGPYLDDIRHVIDATAQPEAGAAVRVATAELGDEAGVIGAARIALEEPGAVR